MLGALPACDGREIGRSHSPIQVFTIPIGAFTIPIEMFTMPIQVFTMLRRTHAPHTDLKLTMNVYADSD